MTITVIPSVQEIFNVTPNPAHTFVQRPDGSALPIAEYVKLSSFDTIGETIHEIKAVRGDVIIHMKKR